MGVDDGGTGDPAMDEEESVEVRSAERLLLFTDAVAAIALTLLILPLVDLVPEVAREHGDARDVITGHRGEIGSFLVSFAVIARLWLVHHRVFATVKTYNQALVLFNLGWLLAVIVLPFPTEMIGEFGSDRFVAFFYYANILFAVTCQTAMVVVLRRHPDMVEEGAEGLDRSFSSGAGNVVALVLAFALALWVPALQYYSLFLLTLVDPVTRLVRRGRAR